MMIQKLLGLIVNVAAQIICFSLFTWVAVDCKVPDFLPKSFATMIFGSSHQLKAMNPIISLLWNSCLVSIFGFVHSALAQKSPQRWLNKIGISDASMRSVYMFATASCSLLIMKLWIHSRIQIWDFGFSDLQNLIAFAFIIAPGLSVLVQFGLMEFVGLKQLFTNTASQAPTATKLVTSGLFKYMRHPLYFFTLAAFVLSPSVSLDRLLFTILCSLYLIVGIKFEERKLVSIFGREYEDYMKAVPAVVPAFTKRVAPIKNKAN